MEQQSQKKSGLPRTWTALLLFLKIGAFTFGGGWSIVAQMEREFVEKRSWLTAEELVDITSVGRSLPGIMIINIAVIFGTRVAGVACGVLCAVGVALPSVIVLSVVTVFYNLFAGNPIVARAMVGVRAAVVPIILCAAWRLKDASFKGQGKVAWLVAAAAFVLCLFTGVSSVLLILSGAALGLLLRGGGHDAVS